jgi:hypothetical protein
MMAPKGKAETSSCPWAGAAGAGCAWFRVFLVVLLVRDQKCDAVARGSSVVGVSAAADASAGVVACVLNGAGADAVRAALWAASLSAPKSAGFLCTSIATAARITSTATTPATMIHLFDEPTDFRLTVLVGGFGTLAFVVAVPGAALREAALNASRLKDPVAFAFNEPAAFALKEPVAFGLKAPVASRRKEPVAFGLNDPVEFALNDPVESPAENLPVAGLPAEAILGSRIAVSRATINWAPL